jgi:rRNA processing protein Gar1
MTVEKLKIALVKQEVYQDLYVCPQEEKSPINILFSSMGRVGPFGLISELHADFVIVKEEYEKETQIYKQIIPRISNDLQLLKTQTLDKLPNQGFKKPGSIYPNGKFSISCYDVDWGKYDIVISINVSLPKKLIQKYEDTLFCYMIGEANLATEKPKFGYDVTLNQLARGIVAKKMGPVDFPYTFVKGDSLERIIKGTYPNEEKKGIYVEINSSKERPAVNVPEQFKPVQAATNETINLHQQEIKDNLLAIYKSKYYVKLGGRITRGNGAIEAISLGTLVLMDPADIIHHEILCKETEFKNSTELIDLINRLNNNEEEYQRLLAIQRSNIDNYVFSKPLESLQNCLEQKRRQSKNKGLLTRIKKLFSNL